MTSDHDHSGGDRSWGDRSASDPWPPFFGEPWDAPVIDDGVRVPTPVGRRCVYCAIEVVEGDQGTFVFAVSDDAADADDLAEAVVEWQPVHRECTLRAVFGPVSHLEGRCTCASDPAAPRSAWREEGLEVLAWLESRKRGVVRLVAGGPASDGTQPRSDPDCSRRSP